MAATHVVSLFLPNTLDFHDEPNGSDSPSPSPLPTTATDKRLSRTLELPSRPSAVSLFTAGTPPLTPSHEDIFGPVAADSSRRYSARIGDPKSLVHSDAEVTAWGSDYTVFNQPRSSAAPLPSGSILDFAKVYDEIVEQKTRATRARVKSPPVSRASRVNSNERSFGSKAWTVTPPIHGNGGLTNAMRVAAETNDTDVTWIGTLGFPTDSLSSDKRAEISDHLLNEFQSDIVYISDKNLEGHYAGFCKTILWPIFHYQVPDHPKSKAYADHSWEFYVNVNQAFADKVIEGYKRGDTIWVHDYHLLLVPEMVRQKLPDAQIGFFLHTAFPSSEIFRCLARRKQLLEGILGANLVAFQTPEYMQHFLQTCSRLLTLETTEEGVQLGDRFVNVLCQPIGINPTGVQEARETHEVQQWIDTLKQRYEGKRLIVARDKLDSVYGVRQKLLAYELFLNKFPQFAGETVLIQVATSANEQSELLITVADICARIDRVHSSLVHQPLLFLKQDIDFAQYLALLAAADVLMVTSLRDGFNLTSHEFVYCQDGFNGGKKHAPVILSEFTGSASIFRGQIPINPWDYHQMADAIKRSLEMNEVEKKNRWSRMHEIVLKHTGGRWAEQLAKALNQAYNEQNQRAAVSIPRLSTTTLCEKYRSAKSRFFIIDYEGTLAPHKTSTGASLAQPARMVEALAGLLRDPRNTVYVMSGRKLEELSLAFRGLRGLGMVAENGAFIHEAGEGTKMWQPLLDIEKAKQWKKDVKDILKYYIERMEYSYIEERHCSVRFRYEKVEDQATALRQAGDCADRINASCKSMGIQAVPISGAVLVESTEVSKATAAVQIFANMREKLVENNEVHPDFLMTAGDDREDEAVFRWANELGKTEAVRDVFTVSMGKRNTEAQAALTQGSTSLLTVLQKLGQVSADELPRDYFSHH